LINIVNYYLYLGDSSVDSFGFFLLSLIKAGQPGRTPFYFLFFYISTTVHGYF